MPDWTDAAAYAGLARVDGAGLAWEWLRRDARYRAAWERRDADRPSSSCCPAMDWGLAGYVDPALPAPEARPVWLASHDPSVLCVAAEPAARGPDAFALDDWPRLARLVRCGCGAEHLSLSDGCRCIRLDVARGTLARGPVRLVYRLAGLASAALPLRTLRRLLALVRLGRFAAELHPPLPRIWRRLLELRAGDALAAGAGQREIAQALFGKRTGGSRWRVASPADRSRAQRLVRDARAMAAGGWTGLLRR